MPSRGLSNVIQRPTIANRLLNIQRHRLVEGLAKDLNRIGSACDLITCHVAEDGGVTHEVLDHVVRQLNDMPVGPVLSLNNRVTTVALHEGFRNIICVGCEDFICYGTDFSIVGAVVLLTAAKCET